MGFTREQIIELYSDIFERFGFDKRELLPSKAEKRSARISASD